MSSTDKSALRFVEEQTAGTTPANPIFETLPFLSSNTFGANPTKEASKVITPTRGVKDLVLLSTESKADFQAPMVMMTMDKHQQAAFMARFTNKPTIFNLAADTQITGVVSADSKFTVASGGGAFLAGHIIKTSGFTNSANNGVFLIGSSASGYVVVTALDGSSVTLTNESSPPYAAQIKVVGYQCGSDDINASSSGLTSTTLDFTTLGLAVGERIKIGGSASGNKFTTAANNDFCRISAIASHSLTFDILPSGWTAENSTGSKELQIFLGDVLRDGSTIITFTGEKSFNDRSPVEYTYVTGLYVDTFQIEFKSKSVSNVSVSMSGQVSSATTTRISGASTYNYSYTQPLNSSNNVAFLREGSSPIDSPNFVTGVTLSIANNLSTVIPVGSPFATNATLGKCTVTGTLSMYTGNNTYITKILDNDEGNLTMGLTDLMNHYYIYEMPRVGYLGGSEAIPGENQQVTLDAKIQALEHPTLGYTIQLQRFLYIPS